MTKSAFNFDKIVTTVVKNLTGTRSEQFNDSHELML